MSSQTANSSRPATVRIATWSARHRFLVLAASFLVAFGLIAFSSILGGQRSLSTAAEGALGGESAVGRRALAAVSGAASFERFVLVVANPSGSLDTTTGRAAVAAIAARLERAEVTIDGRPIPVFAAPGGDSTPGIRVADPFALAGSDPRLRPALVSADGGAVLVEGRIAGSADEVQRKALALRPVLAELRAVHPELRLLALDTQLLTADLIDYATATTGQLLLVTLPLTFLILVLAFRALVAALVPLILALVSVVAAMGLVGIYSRAVEPVGMFAGEFVVLIGLAVAIDYSLFVISRFRTERERGRDCADSVEVASATAGRAVFFSGLAVMVSLGSLIVIDDPNVRSMALGSIAAVLASVAASLTFLPATLAILDTRVNRGRIRFPSLRRSAEGGLWLSIVRAATRRPLLTFAATTLLLLAAASPVAAIRLGSPANDFTLMPRSIEGVRAIALMAEKWPQPPTQTLDVVVTGAGSPAARAAIGRLESAALTLPGVSGPAQVSYAADGSVADVSFALAGGPNDPSSQDVVRRLRAEVVPVALAGTDAQAYVSGDAATALDYTSYFVGRLFVVLPIVLGLSFLLLLVAFHSIAVPLKALALNLLSAGAAIGVLVLVFGHGALGSLTGIRAGTLDASDPVMIFAVLFGLSMDYEVFILARVKEARDRGLSSTEAVETGIALTSGTVTSAALIMVCVFAGFCAVGIRNIQEFGLGLAVAVLVDATLVRSLLLPSTMKLLGDWNWWLPPFLRWLPTVRLEGDAEEPLDPAPTAA